MHRRLAVVSSAALFALGCAACSSSSPSSTGSTTSTTAATTASTTVSGPGGLLGGADDLSTPAVTLQGAGANSIQPFYEKVFYTYHQQNPKLTVNYSPSGSSVGISDIQQQTVDFGQTEIPMSAADQAKATGGTILQIPVDLGGVALSYNLGSATPKGLKLDGPTLAGVFLGTITKWDAPQITALNPGVKLPDLTIVPVHRADSSGPGWDLDQYLIDTSTAWSAKVGTVASKTWPVATVGLGEQLNSGVANTIAQTPGAIGFVEYGYSVQAGFADAAIKNKAGTYVSPSVTSIAQAGAQASSLSSTNFSIIDGLGSETYPLANFSWALVYEKQTNQDNGIALGKLFDWVTTTGQSEAKALGYAPLPANAAALARATILQMETAGGQSLFSH